LFGVCDGHGIYGKEVSQMIKTLFPSYLKRNIIPILRTNGEIGPPSGEVRMALMKTFKEINEELFTSDIDILLSGSTCVIVLVIKD